jgi:hypothetical protein
MPIDETEISAIQAAVKSGLPRLPWPFLEIGNRVAIEHGPLSGVEGVLLGFRGHHRLVLSVTLLKRSVAVQVDEAWVHPIPQQPQTHNVSSTFQRFPQQPMVKQTALGIPATMVRRLTTDEPPAN